MSRMVRLSDVATSTVGFVGTMAPHYVEFGVPMLRSLNIKPFRVEANDLKYITEEFNHSLPKSKLRRNDVLLVRTGNPGNCCVVPEQYVGANCSDIVIIRPDIDRINPYFLASFINIWGRKQIQHSKVGAVQKHFNVRSAEELLILLPDRDEQDKIAEVIEGINRKLNINHQINDNLPSIQLQSPDRSSTRGATCLEASLDSCSRQYLRQLTRSCHKKLHGIWPRYFE